jgi:hypothetical protein
MVGTEPLSAKPMSSRWLMARFVSVDISRALRKMDVAESVIIEESRKIAEELAERGALEMKGNILTSGTEFSEAARRAGINKGPGRYRTGAMYDAVDYRVEAGRLRVSAAFGWIRKFEKYFTYQEEGFRNLFLASYTGAGVLKVSNGQPVIRKNPFGGFKKTPGMFAMRDAAVEVERDSPRVFKNALRRISRKINK